MVRRRVQFRAPGSMSTDHLDDWLNGIETATTAIIAKRLSANDTQANGNHQSGPYLPKEFLFRLFPTVSSIEFENPDTNFDLYLNSHAFHRRARLVYYNSKPRLRRPNGRDELRITKLGGRNSALLDPESTGAIAVFAFPLNNAGEAKRCEVWVSRHPLEDDLIEARIGQVEPGAFVAWHPFEPGRVNLTTLRSGSCWLAPGEIPTRWLANFPTGEEIVKEAIRRRPMDGATPDKRLIERRKCEYQVFRSVEEAIEGPPISEGFPSLESFIARAQTVLQRRKARSGRSLELHVRRILIEEGLHEGEDFEHGVRAEGNKRPDFLFPTRNAYLDSSFPATSLRMLATKTTCKDRWRQILNEADRIQKKHLLTLQEGVSETQFREMTEAGVILVIPAPIIEKFPRSVRSDLLTLENFIADVRLLRS